MSDANECPLCCDAFDFDEVSFFPCECKFKICRFCWNKILNSSTPNCPGCRKPYSENPANFEPMTAEEVQTMKQKRREKQLEERKKNNDKRKHLSTVRVLQSNLVFVVGLPLNLNDVEKLKKTKYFGQYGNIIKIALNSKTAYEGQAPTLTAYVTFSKQDEALHAVKEVNNVQLNGKTLKASLGTTKYCSTWLKNQTCQKTDCMYLHEYAAQEASFTKEDMNMEKHKIYEQKLMAEMVKRKEKEQIKIKSAETSSTSRPASTRTVKSSQSGTNLHGNSLHGNSSRGSSSRNSNSPDNHNGFPDNHTPQKQVVTQQNSYYGDEKDPFDDCEDSENEEPPQKKAPTQKPAEVAKVSPKVAEEPENSPKQTENPPTENSTDQTDSQQSHVTQNPLTQNINIQNSAQNQNSLHQNSLHNSLTQNSLQTPLTQNPLNHNPLQIPLNQNPLTQQQIPPTQNSSVVEGNLISCAVGKILEGNPLLEGKINVEVEHVPNGIDVPSVPNYIFDADFTTAKVAKDRLFGQNISTLQENTNSLHNSHSQLPYSSNSFSFENLIRQKNTNDHNTLHSNSLHNNNLHSNNSLHSNPLRSTQNTIPNLFNNNISQFDQISTQNRKITENLWSNSNINDLNNRQQNNILLDHHSLQRPAMDFTWRQQQMPMPSAKTKYQEEFSNETNITRYNENNNKLYVENNNKADDFSDLLSEINKFNPQNDLTNDKFSTQLPKHNFPQNLENQNRTSDMFNNQNSFFQNSPATTTQQQPWQPQTTPQQQQNPQHRGFPFNSDAQDLLKKMLPHAKVKFETPTRGNNLGVGNHGNQMFSPQNNLGFHGNNKSMDSSFSDWMTGSGNHGNQGTPLNKSLSSQMTSLTLTDKNSPFSQPPLQSAFSDYNAQQRVPPGLFGTGNPQKLRGSPPFDPAIIQSTPFKGSSHGNQQPMGLQQNQEPHWMRSIHNLTNEKSPSPRPMGAFGGFRGEPMGMPDFRTNGQKPPGF